MMNPTGDAIPGLYRHYKGGTYRVLCMGKDSNNDRKHEPTVIYISLSDGRHRGQICVRHLEEFNEPVCWPDSVTRPRFKFEGITAHE